MTCELVAHPIANLLIDALSLEIAARPRVAIERAGPPVERALARVWRQRPVSREDRSEDVGGGAERLVEEERLTDSDQELDTLARTEPLRVEAAQPLARARQIVGDAARAKAFQKGARGNQVGAVRERRHPPRRVGGSDRCVELAFVIERPCARDWILDRRRRPRGGRLREGGRRRDDQERCPKNRPAVSDHSESKGPSYAVHGRDGTTGPFGTIAT